MILSTPNRYSKIKKKSLHIMTHVAKENQKQASRSDAEILDLTSIQLLIFPFSQ